MKMSRRSLIKSTAVVGGGLVLGLQFGGCQKIPYPHLRAGAFQPNAFLQITSDDQIIIQIFQAEMGQGATTAIPTLIAEELQVDPQSVHIEFSGIHADYRDPNRKVMQTGSSIFVSHFYDILRQAGATAREMLIAAAAQSWNTDASQCYADNNKRSTG